MRWIDGLQVLIAIDPDGVMGATDEEREYDAEQEVSHVSPVQSCWVVPRARVA